jgi:hypothetical protein
MPVMFLFIPEGVLVMTLALMGWMWRMSHTIATNAWTRKFRVTNRTTRPDTIASFASTQPFASLYLPETE